MDLTDNDAMIALKGPYISIIFTNAQSKAQNCGNEDRGSHGCDAVSIYEA